MNPLLHEAAASVRLGWLMAGLTVVFFAAFLGWVWYAYHPARRERLDEAAKLPFMDGGEG